LTGNNGKFERVLKNFEKDLSTPLYLYVVRASNAKR